MIRTLRRFVRERAGRQCEYCHLPEKAAAAVDFHLEHVIARQHGGANDASNRCWSCHRCNLRKGPNLSGRDPDTGRVVRLFNPRRQVWRRHFLWRGPILVGRTAIGRATIAVLDINNPQRIDLRRILMNEARWAER